METTAILKVFIRFQATVYSVIVKVSDSDVVQDQISRKGQKAGSVSIDNQNIHERWSIDLNFIP